MTDIYVEKKYGFEIHNGGAQTNTILKNIDITEENTTGDIIRVATLPKQSFITNITIGCTSISGLSDVDLGIYKTDFGNVLKKDLFSKNQNLETETRTIDGLKSVEISNISKNIKDLYDIVNSDDLQEQFVDVALTLNSKPASAGSIVIKIEYC